jgi:hypothetical protein
MYKAQGSLTWLQVAEVRHSIERSDGFTNSRDCTKEAPTGSQGMAGEFAVVRSQEALLDFTYEGWTPHLKDYARFWDGGWGRQSSDTR